MECCYQTVCVILNDIRRTVQRIKVDVLVINLQPWHRYKERKIHRLVDAADDIDIECLGPLVQLGEDETAYCLTRAGMDAQATFLKKCRAMACFGSVR